MGMFTTILDPAQNLSVQIKCGWDTCETFSVGDTVPWEIIKDWPNQGYLLDDAYLGIGGTPEQDDACSWDDYWVVIKNHVVQEVFLYKEGDWYPELRERYQIQDPPEDLWTEEVWGSYREELARRKKEDAEFEASLSGLSPVDRFSALIHRTFGRRVLDYGAIGRELVKVQALPEGVPPVYYLDLDPDDE